MAGSGPGARPDEDWVARLRAAGPPVADAPLDVLERLAAALRRRGAGAGDFESFCGFLFAGSVAPCRKALIPPCRSDTNVAAVLRMARQLVALGNGLEPAALQRGLRGLAREADWSEAELLGAVAVAVSGRADPPSLADCMCLLGAPACIERLDAAIDLLGNPENPILGQARRQA